ncbi:hypothetical protein [Thalassospira sp. TSL5-1]|uniref:hypothetical protein n=1 Tax=Thalassospira sp. TSL5-1 TaxID=1544451 RepID=UPI0009403946|nr:hypothetical protein [Thalassospira sp. TSL5-1]OKH88555.1 hypothetical protein LF95_00050 [Thalassospira sp. TSL5-1]
MQRSAHTANVVVQGVGRITLYGTTGEGASLGMNGHATMLDAVKDSGVTAGIAACGPEGAEGSSAPTSYFKGITDDTLFH